MTSRAPIPHAGRAIAIYLGTLAVFFAASYFTGARVWGVAAWGYFPVWMRLTGLAAGVAVGFAALLFARSSLASTAGGPIGAPARPYWPLYIGIPLVWGGLCYLLRTQAHFLGDGAFQLALLAGDQPLFRARSFGTMALCVALKRYFGSGDQAALNIYRTVAISAGVLFSATAIAVAHELFDSLGRRLLFILGMLSAGFALLFFGYVENYAYFCLSVAFFTCAGFLIGEGKLRRAWILLPLALSVFFHILGLVLVPAAIYILICDSRLARAFARGSTPVRGAIVIVVVVTAVLLFAYLYRTSYYFRFAFVPLFPGRLVVEGYTLFAGKHLLDWLNLQVMLLPGVCVLVAGGWRSMREASRKPAIRFGLILLASAALATFMLDPKIGMPRDWDLFAFTGIPAAALAYLVVLGDRERSPSAILSAALAVALGFLLLLPRAAVGHAPARAIEQMEDYARLDVRKNRTGVYALAGYLLNEGYVSAYARVRAFQDSIYVEDSLSARAGELVRRQRYKEVRPLAQQLIAVNPQMFSGWLYLGRVYNTEGRYDSARVALSIADGLNPQSTGVLNELGLAYYYGGDKNKAEKIWLQSLALDPTQFAPHYSLARVYRDRGDNERYVEQLRAAAMHGDAPAGVSLELADYYLGRREFQSAKGAIQRALSLGADSTAIHALDRKYPGLVDWKVFSAPADSTGNQPR
jgi:cytochrome c-type biogenesis protein CcmH/NrfG